jgi:hypothetical protein
MFIFDVREILNLWVGWRMDDWNVPRQTERHLQLVTGNTVKEILVSGFLPKVRCFPSKVSKCRIHVISNSPKARKKAVDRPLDSDPFNSPFSSSLFVVQSDLLFISSNVS